MIGWLSARGSQGVLVAMPTIGVMVREFSVVGQALATFKRIVEEPVVMEDYEASRRVARFEVHARP